MYWTTITAKSSGLKNLRFVVGGDCASTKRYVGLKIKETKVFKVKII